MAVDLKSATTFGRTSLILFQDRLIRLEHGRTKDRVRSVLYDTIESILIWQRTRWVIAVVSFVAFGLLALVSGVAGDWNQVADVFAVAFLVMAIIAFSWAIYVPRYTIRLVRSDRNVELVGSFRPGKFKRFRDQFVAAVRAAQESAAQPPPSPPAPAEQTSVIAGPPVAPAPEQPLTP